MQRLTILLLTGALCCLAQVYSPTVVKQGQPDASSLESLVQGIYASSGATTPRGKAEAIWRFFLTDGRFVKPGFWYHIAGWAYEEPKGEVLDPVKLLNSYVLSLFSGTYSHRYGKAIGGETATSEALGLAMFQREPCDDGEMRAVVSNMTSNVATSLTNTQVDFPKHLFVSPLFSQPFP